MAEASAGEAGRVSATPERPPPRKRYDIVVLGGGLLGAAVADRLRVSRPEWSLLLVEQDGLPNEGGATVASPGLIPPPVRMAASAAGEGDRHGPAGAEATSGSPRAASDAGAVGLAWARAWLREALEQAGSQGARAGATGRAGWLVLATGAEGVPEESRPLGELVGPDVADALEALTGADADRPARLLDGGYVSSEALALALARRAVAAGADLVLNARARPQGPGTIVLERLAADRRMRVGVRARQALEAGAVVVACGAAGAAVAEEGLDRPVALPSAYLQFPRVRWSAKAGAPRLPVVSLAGWTWRPAPGGAVLVPPPPPPDPEGFVPAGGRLLGVPVGLRRELLDRLMAEPALAPLLASGRLELGKSVRVVRGARFSVPGGGRPVAERLVERWWLLAGGTLGLPHDLAAAAELASEIAGVAPPWRA